jgi:pSer/pThr/pTyr-binding forkhead associated (FHA) protein
VICQQESPLLVIVGSSSGDRRLELRQDYMVVGREPTCDIWLDDPHVSRTHAALQCRGNAVYVTDLGSSGGTFVDGSAVSAPRELHPGDVVSFASVAARFEPAALGTAIGPGGAAATPARPVPYQRPVAHERPVGYQRPVGHERPAGYQRPVGYERSRWEAARTRGRWLCWTGLVVLVEGCAIAAITRVSLPRPSGGGLAQLRLGPSVAGVPSATLGLALVVVGVLLLLGGLSQRP